MKFTKTIIAALMVGSVIFSPSNHTYAAVRTESPVLLQVNEYNILYTFPKQPYIDQNNRLMIPLRAISELLNGTVSYDAAKKEAAVILNGKTLTVTADSKIINLDSTIHTMDTVPVIYKQSLFIPLRVLMDNLGLKAQRDERTGVVHIDNELLDQTKMIKFIKEFDRAPSIANRNAILPLHYDLQIANIGEEDKLLNGQIKITAKNISNTLITKDKEDLHVIFIFNESLQMEADSNTTDLNNERERPILQPNQTFERTLNFTSGNYNENLKYILAIGRVFE